MWNLLWVRVKCQFKCHSLKQLVHRHNAVLYVVRSAPLKPWMFNRTELTVKDGTVSSHLSQLHLFHCWLQCLGQLIYGSLTNSSLTMEQQAAALFTSSHTKMTWTWAFGIITHILNLSHKRWKKAIKVLYQFWAFHVVVISKDAPNLSQVKNVHFPVIFKLPQFLFGEKKGCVWI